MLGRKAAGVHFFEDYYAPVPADAPMQLRGSRIDGVNTRRAAPQQAIGEPAGRSADVKARRAAHIDDETVERSLKLQPAAADEAGTPADETNRRRGRDLPAGFFGFLFVNQNFARQHHRLGFMARVRETPFDQESIDSHAFLSGQRSIMARRPRRVKMEAGMKHKTPVRNVAILALASALAAAAQSTKIELARRLADQGNAEFQFNLGVMYDNGKGVPQDYQEAVKWYRQAAQQGIAPAQHNLGVMYDNGKGVPQDYQEAVKWYRQAAQQGIAPAQHNLGVMYDNGKGVPQDYQEAVKWYRQAAQQGIAPAQSNLGVMYDNGKGVPQDYQEAVKWYRQAAQQGHAPAQFNLGVMYDNGEGVPQDYQEAVKWYRQAAQQGHAPAQFNLGVMYDNGEGVPQDHVQAYKWLNLAASQAVGEEAKLYRSTRDAAEETMTPSQIAEAQRLAREWLSENQ